MTLPYQRASSGRNAIEEMRKILLGVGCSNFGVMDDFANGRVIVQFEHHGRRVSLEASFAGYAAAWLRENPWNARRKSTYSEHEARARAQAAVSVYSILRDWIKGQVTAIEIGMMSFEGAFLGQIMLPDGRRVLDAVTDRRGQLSIGHSLNPQPEA